MTETPRSDRSLRAYVSGAMKKNTSLFALGMVVACGPAPPPVAYEPPHETRPPAVAVTTAAARDSLVRDAHEGCRAACAYAAACAGAGAVDTCESDCRDGLVAHDTTAAAQQFSACVQAVSCEVIRASMARAVDAVAACRVHAMRMAR